MPTYIPPSQRVRMVVNDMINILNMINNEPRRHVMHYLLSFGSVRRREYARRMIKELEALGYIGREYDGQKRRLFLTEKGLLLVRKINGDNNGKKHNTAVPPPFFTIAKKVVRELDDRRCWR